MNTLNDENLKKIFIIPSIIVSVGLVIQHTQKKIIQGLKL